jgi:hypothetical protein
MTATATPTDTRAALLSWAGRDGCFGDSDIEALTRGHGETSEAWFEHCWSRYKTEAYAYNAEALLAWLKY